MGHEDHTHSITQLLEGVSRREDGAADELVRRVYAELEHVARLQLSGERAGHTLQPSDLVHEAWLRLIGPLEAQAWPSRRYFYRAAAEAMRRVLTDHARRRGREKRGGGGHQVTLNVLEVVGREDGPDFLEVDEAVQRLEEKDERLGQVVRLRFYAGLTVAEAAEALGVSEGTILRDWRFARAWLYRVLAKGA
jgi:RNA polymerase sigma factor (TIGR02999 family)